MTDRPVIGTLGELRASGYRSRSVKEEMRANLVDRLRRGESLLPGIIGYSGKPKGGYRDSGCNGQQGDVSAKSAGAGGCGSHLHIVSHGA